MECRTRMRSFAITLVEAIWFCFAILLISTMSFFSCCSRAVLSLSSSRMDLSMDRLCSRSTCAGRGKDTQRHVPTASLKCISMFARRMRTSAGVFLGAKSHIEELQQGKIVHFAGRQSERARSGGLNRADAV